MTWLSAVLLSKESFQMTVSETRASATLGVQSGVRMRGVAYDDLHERTLSLSTYGMYRGHTSK